MCFFRGAAGVLLLLFVTTGLFAQSWFIEQNHSSAAVLSPDAQGIISADVEFPGNALIYMQRDRKQYRAEPKDFLKTQLHLEVKVESKGLIPLRGNLFIKDKDGIWFQGGDLSLKPGDWQNIDLDLTRDGNTLRPVGHGAAWNSNYAMNIMSVGLSLYGSDKAAYQVRLRNLDFTGKREFPPLRVIDWKMPSKGRMFETLESSFDLSREYFNPFDPDDIMVDVEVESPSGKTIRFPAFYSQNFIRKRHFTKEIILPEGKAFWALRFTPQEPGAHKLRLQLTDKSSGASEKLTTPWQTLQVEKSDLKGFLRVSPSDPRYYEFSTGEFFYPVGLNVHTNIDLRSEKSFKFGHLPDRGTYDYDEYLDAMGKGGINTVEIWMASWTFSMEWNSVRPYYYGLGRYNLANAWRLDHVFNRAKANNMFIHLVLDNHGKMSSHSDQEWEDSPFNKDNIFAAANGGFLSDTKSFFTDEKAIKLNESRNRYIAARWGAQTNIFAIEFWSELDLVTNHDEVYNNGKTVDWHAKAARDLRNADQGKHILSTHLCGDYTHHIKFKRYYELPEIEHVIGDAYRSPKIHFLDQLKNNSEALNIFKKPILVTEYGGTPSGSDKENVIGDIHCGQWGAFFTKHAGTPFLWWHDFVHLNKLYPHYYGVARYMQDIDPRNRPLVFKPITVDPLRIVVRQKMWDFVADDLGISARGGLALVPRESYSGLEGLAAGTPDAVYGWIYFRDKMLVYPEDQTKEPQVKELKLRLPYRLENGDYRMMFFDTLTGKCLSSEKVTVSGNFAPLFTVPTFNVDIAFKLRRTLPFAEAGSNGKVK